MFRKNKRGLSDLVSNVLIILLVFASIAIMGVIILNLVKLSGSSIENATACKLIDVKPVQCIHNVTDANLLFSTKYEPGVSITNVDIISLFTDGTQSKQSWDGSNFGNFETQSVRESAGENNYNEFYMVTTFKDKKGVERACTSTKVKCELFNPDSEYIETIDNPKVCGSAARSYLSSESIWINPEYCKSGALNATPNFPLQGKSSYWKCGTEICRAFRNAASNSDGGGGGGGLPDATKVNGVCGTSLDSCSAGTYRNDTDNSTDYKWICVGTGGGTTASCSSHIVGNYNNLFAPMISFVNPTPPNAFNLDGMSIYVNVSSSDDGTHYVVNDFDNSLVLWLRMEQGNGTYFVDEKGKNNATVYSPTYVSDIAGSPVLGFNYEDGAYTATGNCFRFDVYAYRDVYGTRIYSQNPVQISGCDDYSSSSYHMYSSWTPVSGADGYRVLIDDDVYDGHGADCNSNYCYFDTQTAAFITGTSVIGDEYYSGGYLTTSYDIALTPKNVGTNKPTFNPNGYWNGSYTFNGVNNSIIVPNSSSLDLRNKNWTMASWVYINGYGSLGLYSRIFGRDSNNFEIGVNSSGSLHLYKSIWRNTGYTLSTGKWYFVGLTWNGTSYTTYVNNSFSQVNGVGGLSPSSVNYGDLFIGGSYKTAELFNGIIDDTFIFNRSLTSKEMLALYDATTNQYYNNFTNLRIGNYTTIAYAVDRAGNKNMTDFRTIRRI